MNAIPGDSTLQFVIGGTDNMLSVQTAGNFAVITQIYEKSSGNHYNIDAGDFPSNFKT